MSIRFVFAKIQINHEYGKEIVLFNQFFGRPPILSPDVMPAGLKSPPAPPQAPKHPPAPLKPLRLPPSPLRLLPRYTLLGEKLKNNDEMDGMAPLSDNRNRGLIWSVISN